MTTPTVTALRRGGAPPVYVLQLTLYTHLGAVIVREVGNEPGPLVAHAQAMLAEGSAKFWRIGNFPT